MQVKDLKKGQRIMWRRHKLDQSVYATVSKITEDRTIAYILTDDGKLQHLCEGDDFAILPEKVPQHYTGSDGIDVIEFMYQQSDFNDFVAMTRFNIVKYATRLGRKDDMAKELDKIIDYAERLKEKL